VGGGGGGGGGGEDLLTLREDEKPCAELVASSTPGSRILLRVHTHQQSPVQSSQTRKDAAVTLWLAYNGNRGSAYTPAESSRVTRVLPSHES